MKNPGTLEEFLAEEMRHRDYQLALCEDFSFLDNFNRTEEDND